MKSVDDGKIKFFVVYFLTCCVYFLSMAMAMAKFYYKLVFTAAPCVKLLVAKFQNEYATNQAEP
jgi:hypothetical protein